MKKLFFFLLLSCSLSAFAQRKVAADKVLVIVGDKIILQSDITNAIADIERRGGTVPPNAECFILEQSIISKALMIQAEKDSLPVTDAEVEAEIDLKIRNFIEQFGGREALEQVAGQTVYQLRENFKDGIRENKLAMAMRGKIEANVKITPVEVQAYYDRIPKDSLNFYESMLEVGTVEVFPKASRELEEYVIAEMNNYKRQVESGVVKFELLVSRFSEDPGSKETGGIYELNRADKFWDPSFLAAAFRLKEVGQVSPVVKSNFGYHIIQLVSRQGDVAVVRHILRIPPITEDEIAKSAKHLDSVRSKIVANTLTFNEAVNKYNEDKVSKFTGGMKQAPDGGTMVSIDQLDKDIVLALKDLKEGEISQPQSFTTERGQKGVRLIFLKSRTEPHRENMKDDYNRIAQRALEAKKQKALEKWLTDKMNTFYIKLNDQNVSCPTVLQWTAATSAAKK